MVAFPARHSAAGNASPFRRVCAPRSASFERGSWQAHHSDEELGTFIRSAYDAADALLLGRVTSSIWESYWPYHDDNTVGHTINVLPKYVPSTTVTHSTWQNTHFLDGDVEARVRELKAKPGRDLLLPGSGQLVRWLLERDLVDELALVVYPVVVGDGLRLFPERGPTHSLELIESEATTSGITIQTYRPAGRASLGTVGA